MRCFLSRVAAAAALLAGTSASAGVLEDGRDCAQAFFARDIGRVWSRLSPELKKGYGSPDGLRAFRQKVANDFGQEVRVVSEERVGLNGGAGAYVRRAAFSRYGGAIELVVSFDSRQRVTELSMRKASVEAPTPHLNHRTRTSLRLPFDGSWWVLWGGRTVAENRHAVVSDERFACDLLVVEDGRTFAGDGTKIEQYYCFNQPVLAPADGVVVEVENGVPDNQPGIIRSEQLYGNHVVIDHGNGEFSMLAHLREGSVAARLGRRVRAGEFLARCGSSGISTEPHLHYQLMDSDDYRKAHGLPAQFRDYWADGRHVARGEPKRSQAIEFRPGAKSTPVTAAREGRGNDTARARQVSDRL